MPAKKQLKNNQQFLKVTCVVLLLALALVMFKYLRLKAQWNSYAGDSQRSIFMWSGKSAEDHAKLIAMGVLSKIGGQELYKNKPNLQSYVSSISNGLNRDIVLMDRNKMILADAMPANVGKKYMEDNGDEVSKTMSDGITRTFTETSSDYPQGIEQTVVAIKDLKGMVVGAVVFSTDEVK